jgi:hypothetical protein
MTEDEHGKLVVLMEREWFQIALKTYFWSGIVMGVVGAVSVGCLLGTKYYHDQAAHHYRGLEAQYNSYSVSLTEARREVQETNQIWREVYGIWQKFDTAMKEIDGEHGKEGE